MDRRLLSALAALALAWASSAQADPLTLDTLLGVETFGRIAVDPTGATAVFEERRARDDLPRYDLQPEGMLRYARLYRFDVDGQANVRPLLPMEPDAGYTLGPFSPDGSRVVVFRLQGLTYRLGVVDLATHAVLWTDLTPDDGAWGRAVEWISGDTLVALVLSDGTLPPRLAQTRTTQARLPDLWARAARGEAAWVSVGTGAPPPDRPVRRLVRIDARTGRSTDLSEGAFLDLEAAPDGRTVALIEDGPLLALPGPETTSAIRRRRALRLVDVASGTSTDPTETKDISTSLLSWSPRSNALLVAALDGPAPRLLAIRPTGETLDVTPPDVTPDAAIDAQLLPTARAGWLGDVPVVQGTRDGQPGWFLRDGARAVRIADLDQTARLVAQGEAAVLFNRRGRIVRIDADGRQQDLGEAVSVARPDGPLGQRALSNPMKADSAAVKAGADRICRVAAAPGPRLCIRGAPGTAASWTLGVSVGAGAQGRAADRLERHTLRSTETVWRLNSELDRTLPTPPRRIVGPQGPLGWLYLPTRIGDRPPPVVVIPYPGRVHPAPPRTMRPETGHITQNGELMVAAGYAVLFPDLPSTPEPSLDLAAHILAPVDVAAAEGLVDGRRVGLWGHSFGAWASVLSATQSDRFGAVVALNGSYNMPAALALLSPHDRLSGTHDDGIASAARWLEAGQVGMVRSYWADPERYRRASAFERVDAVRAPILLVQGEMDPGVGQAEQMYAALHRLGRPATLTYLFGEDHSLHSPGNARVYYDQVLGWFERYLRPVDATLAPTSAGPRLP